MGAMAEDPITPEEFFRADIRVGMIVRAEEFPQARTPAYKLWIDFGELGTRTSSAQLTAFYQAEGLAGRLVLAVVNSPPGHPRALLAGPGARRPGRHRAAGGPGPAGPAGAARHPRLLTAAAGDTRRRQPDCRRL